MKYLHFTTKILKDLVPDYKGGSFPWEKLGTSAKSINMDAIDGGNTAPTPSQGIAYILPIDNESKSLSFILEKLTPNGIMGEIIEEDEALEKWKEYKKK